MGVGSNIRQLLKEQNKSMQWLSQNTGISVNTLYSITRKDKSNVRPKNLEAIAHSFGISVKELISDTNNSDIEQSEVSPEKNNPTSYSSASPDTSSKGTRYMRLSDAIAEYDAKEFKKTIKERKEAIAHIQNSHALPQQILDHILERKLDELELLKLFFLLTPRHRKIAITSIKHQLINQEMLKFDEDSENLDNYDDWLSEEYAFDIYEPTDDALIEERIKIENASILEKEFEHKLNEKLEQLETNN